MHLTLSSEQSACATINPQQQKYWNERISGKSKIVSSYFGKHERRPVWPEKYGRRGDARSSEAYCRAVLINIYLLLGPLFKVALLRANSKTITKLLQNK